MLLEIDEATAFDYEDPEKARYSHEAIKQLLVQEIMHF